VRKLFEELKQEEILHQELVSEQLSKLPPDSGRLKRTTPTSPWRSSGGSAENGVWRTKPAA
jgi:hypothetical protein